MGIQKVLLVIQNIISYMYILADMYILAEISAYHLQLKLHDVSLIWSDVFDFVSYVS